MKICTKCKLEKDLKNFYKGRSMCKDCHKAYKKDYYMLNKHKSQTSSNKWYLENKDKVKSYVDKKVAKAKRFKERVLKKFPCKACGMSNINYLEFDHIDIKDKKHRISSMCSEGRTLKAIKKEMRKCQVLCVACHKKKTKLDIKKDSSYFSKRSRKIKIEFIDFLSIGVIPILG